MSLELDERTKALVKEAFGGKVCVACGGHADRYLRRAYYCSDCAHPRARCNEEPILHHATHPDFGGTPSGRDSW